MFDAGVADGTVMLRVLRAMHDRFPHMPVSRVGKEISLEDVRLALQKMSDRFCEHPATVLILTISPIRRALARGQIAQCCLQPGVREAPLTGASAHQFEQQITDLVPFLAQTEGGREPKDGNPV